MAEFSKPDVNTVWSDSGTNIEPSNAKIAQGWIVEKPPFEFFNWLDNRQDQFIAHINQLGYPAWDSTTEYQADRSYVIASDNNVYKAVTTHTNQDPTAATGDWELAFTDATTLVGKSPSDFTDATATVPSGSTWYEDVRHELNGFFDAGEYVRIIRIGDMVTITSEGSLTHIDDPNGIILSDTNLPAQFIPNNLARNVCTESTGDFFEVLVRTDSRIELNYTNSSGSGVSSGTSSPSFTITYNRNN